MDRQSYADGDRSSYGKSPFDKSPILSKLHDSNLAATFTRASQNAEALPPGDGTTQRITISRPPSTASLTISTRPQEEVIYIPGPQGENELEAPLLPARSTPNPEMEHKLQFAYTVSWIVNIALFIAKGYAFYISHSKSVLASLVDSMVDLVSQLVIFIAEYQSKKADPKFPVGKARLETLGVLACACIMSVSAYAVIQDSGSALYDGLAHDIFPELDAGWLMYAVLGAATGLKLICYILCVALQNKSDSMLALAEDHLNDIVSNVGAAATSAVAAFVADAWWADPTGGILISLFILWRWYEIAKSQLEKIVGKGAPDDMLDQLTHLVNSHHDNLSMDCLRAYHFGARYMVEAEVIMPVHFTLKEVHDISLHLQHKLEAIPEVERAFVHVDYESRPEPEHRTERILAGLPMVVEETALGSPLCKHGSGHRNHSGGGGLESHEVSGALMSKDSASANSLTRPS